MTHRGAHASRGLATRSYYCALWLLGNKVNAGRHGFRCSPPSHISPPPSFLLSPLFLLHSLAVTVSTHSLTLPATPPTSSRKKAFYGHRPERAGEAALVSEFCVLSFVKRHFSKCHLPFYGLS